MKRTSFIVLGLVMACGLVLVLGAVLWISRAAVGAEPLAPDAIAVGLITDGPTVEDNGFNWFSYQGVLRAESELGITYQVYTSSSAVEYEPNVQQCVLDGNDLCISVGFLTLDAISNTAAANPGVNFAIVDVDGVGGPSNLRGITFASDEAGYLAGSLAGMMSESDVIGVVGGMQIPPVEMFVTGYTNGARCANPQATVLISYTGTFVDPALGAESAQILMNQGADVVFGVGGETGNGAVLTATQSGAWGIGVDTDQYVTLFDSGAVAGADRLLSSAIKRMDNAVFDTISDAVSGTFTGGATHYTVADDGVELAPYHETLPLVPLGVQYRISGTLMGLRTGTMQVDGPCVATLGVAADLSGPVSDLGWQEVNAARLAVDQTNAAGGLNLGGVTYTLNLLEADSACNSTQAITAAETLLNAGAFAVVGHTCSSASDAAQPLYAAAGIPMVSPSSTSPNLTQQGFTTTFRTVSHDASPTQYMATYFHNWLGYARSAMIVQTGDWLVGGQWLADIYSDTFTALGGTITSQWLVSDTGDFTGTLNAIKLQNPDVIFVAGYAAEEPGQISRIAYEIGMDDVPIAWDAMDVAPMWMYAYLDWAGAEAAEGDFIAMHGRPFWAMPGWEVFLSDYQAASFDNMPDDPGPLGAFAYDATNILVDALTRAGSLDLVVVRDAVATTAGYDGVVGTYEGFDANGDVIPQWLWIAKYEEGDWQPQIANPHIGDELRVCSRGCEYATVQDAVNAAAEGDTIKVAAGTYSDLHSRTAPPDYYGPSVITQVVYVDKSITLRGGYTTTDWVVPDPLNNVTRLDAQDGGRVLVVAGYISPTIEGFHITGGNANGLRGSDRAGGATDAGGGVFIIHAPNATLYNCQIYSNTAHQGGGIYLDRVPAFLRRNDIYANTANWGGGIALWDSHATIAQNTISANTAITGGGVYLIEDKATLQENLVRDNLADIGGGVYLDQSEAFVQSNTIVSNTANFYSAGVHIYDSDAALFGNTVSYNIAAGEGGGGIGTEFCLGGSLKWNTITDNEAKRGAGLQVFISKLTIDSNFIADNVASEVGGGIYFHGPGEPKVLNNVIVRNHATHHGGAMMLTGAFPQMVHTTFASNTSGDGSAIYIEDWLFGDVTPSDAYFENTILADSDVGINIIHGSNVNMQGILWHNVPVTVTQSPTATVTVAQQFTEDPLFVDPTNDDYHIGQGSPAIDRVGGDLLHDMDAQPRPMGMGYDLGADEYPDARVSNWAVWPEPIVKPGQYVAHTVVVTSDGATDATNVVLTYHLDPWQRAVGVVGNSCLVTDGDWGGDVVCTLGTLSPGTTLEFVFSLQIAPHVPLGQLMVNVGEITANELASGFSVRTVSQARLTYPLDSDPSSLDVNREAGNLQSWTILEQLMDAPYRYLEDSSLVPAGATGYTVSPDGLVYTVTLRADATWSDGVPVTAQHYVDGILRLLNPATGAFYGYVLYPIQGAEDFYNGLLTDPTDVGVTALDDLTLRFTLHTPAGYFPSLLATSAAFPVRLDALPSPQSVDDFVGNGPYTLVAWEQEQWMLLEKNPRYHSAADVAISRVLIPFMPGEAQLLAYQKGELSVSAAPDSDLEAILADPTLSNELRQVPLPGVIYLGMNTQLQPTDGVTVRKALAAAIDRHAILEALHTPWQQTATSVIPPGFAGYQSGDIGYTFNPTQAQALLADAGYPGGAGFPGLEVWANLGNETLVGAVADSWRNTLGIDVTPTYQDFGVYFNDLSVCREDPSTCTYNAYRLGWVVGYADATNLLNDVFHPDASYEFTGWENARYRELMELQLAETNPISRVAYLQEADRILVEDEAAVIPLHFPSKVLLITPEMDYAYPPSGAPHFADWRVSSGLHVPCYARVSSLPGITYTSVQDAVDAARAGDTVKVAGTCVEVQGRARKDLVSTGMVTQVVYIDKNLTLRGGYTTTDWLRSDPQAYPTTLDAQGQGRVLYVTGDVTVTVEDLRIAGGDGAGQRGSVWSDEDAGGGVYIITATVILKHNRISDNIVNGSGGGVYLHHSASILEKNILTLNRSGWGGGMYAYESPANLLKNVITANGAASLGGGIYFNNSEAKLNRNKITYNTASLSGGGVNVFQSDVVFNANVIRFNAAALGGGVYVNRSGGIWANTVIADNRATEAGSGVCIVGGSPHLLHTTLARNSEGDGTAVYITEHPAAGIVSHVMLTNTILVDQDVGVYASGGNTAYLDAILWYNTPVTVSAASTATVTISQQWNLNPDFAEDGYHLQTTSPALDLGVPVSLTSDVDGDPRPYGHGFELGADEVPFITVEPDVETTLVHTDTEGMETTLVVPAGAVSETTTIVLTTVEEEDAEAPANFAFAGVAFDLDAYQGETKVVSFTKSVTLTLRYTDADVADVEESTLKLYRLIPQGTSTIIGTWEPIGTRTGETQTLDIANNVITGTLVRFSRFGTYGLPLPSEPFTPPLFLPIVLKG